MLGVPAKIKLSISNIYISVLETLISAGTPGTVSITTKFMTIYLITLRDLYKISITLNISQYDKPYLN